MPEGHWLIFNTQSVFGASLAGQGKFDEAETLLLDAYAGLNGKPETIPAAVRDRRLGEALQRIVDLYEAWDKPEEAAEWGARPAADPPEPGADHGGGD